MSGMDFFGHQERAQALSRRLVLLFALAVLGIVGCVYAAAAFAFHAVEPGARVFEPGLFGGVLIGVLGVVALGTLWQTAQLRSGGPAVAEMLGGTEVGPMPSDPGQQMLRNVVEEMAIAAGVPVPAIYVLEGEAGLNAFAAGWSPADAAIAVTRGCLDQLDRDELQGVVAHEFSHVFHGDMRLNIRLLGVLFGIVCLSTIGRVLVRMTRGVRDRKGNAQALVLFGVFLVVIGWLGVLFARLIQAAVSRQREFLADASAVQYTRNPRGIGMALAKIGGLTSKLESAHADQASHLLFAEGITHWFGSAFASHPPIEERVERVLPGFRRQLAQAPSLAAAAAMTPTPALAPAPAGTMGIGGAPARPAQVGAQRLAASVGAPAAAHVDAARSLLQSLPLDLAAATHEPPRAHALALALLLDRQPARREPQLRTLPADDVALQHGVRQAFQQLTELGRDRRLPLLELAMPALRALPAERKRSLREQARRLALADGELSPFEFALLKTLERHVRLPDESVLRPPGRPQALAEQSDAATLVLSVLAHAGAHGDAVKAEAAFARGSQALALRVSLLPREQCRVERLDEAMPALAKVSPLGKRNLVQACTEAAAADGTIDADEADLLRALAESWDCPMPLPADA